MAKTEKTVPMRSFVGVTDNSCANQETPRTTNSKTAFIDAQTRSNTLWRIRHVIDCPRERPSSPGNRLSGRAPCRARFFQVRAPRTGRQGTSVKSRAFSMTANLPLTSWTGSAVHAFNLSVGRGHIAFAEGAGISRTRLRNFLGLQVGEHVAPVEGAPGFFAGQSFRDQPGPTLTQGFLYVLAEPAVMRGRRAIRHQLLIQPGAGAPLGQIVQGYRRQQLDFCPGAVSIELRAALGVILGDQPGAPGCARSALTHAASLPGGDRTWAAMNSGRAWGS